MAGLGETTKATLDVMLGVAMPFRVNGGVPAGVD